MSKIRTLLQQAHCKYKDKGNNVGRYFINICCPFCGESHYHLGIHETELYFKCFVCSEGGSWVKLRPRLQQRYPNIDWYSIKIGQEQAHYVDTPVDLPHDLQKLTRTMTKNDIVPYQYLTEVPYDEELYNDYRPRGIEHDLLRRIQPGVGIGKLNGYVTFKEGQSLIARNYDGRKARWWKAINDDQFIFGRQAVNEVQPKWVVLTEGVFDNLSVPYGHSLSLLGSSLSTGWIAAVVEALPKHTTDIIIGLDRGVNTKTINTYTLLFNDCGLNVTVWDWNDDLLYGLNDLDEVRLILGRKFVNNKLLQLVGLQSTELIETELQLL